MSNRYEQSLKEQAARIRRELAGEKETKPVERPKKEEREDRFVLTDVPSPIYGFQRPRKQRSIQEEIHSEESEVDVSSVQEEEKSEESLEHETEELNEESRIETMEQTDLTEADAGLVPTTDADILVPEPTIEENSSSDVSEEQVEADVTTESSLPAADDIIEVNDTVQVSENPATEEMSKEETMEEAIEETPEETSVEEKSEMTLEEHAVHGEDAEPVQLSTGTLHVDSQTEEPVKRVEEVPSAENDLVAEIKVENSGSEKVPTDQPVQIKKPVGPPVNVVMTTKDLMAMYRARREQNNLNGK
ncbi:hypothetical protein [Exiguobacterium sp. RIT594]|uniref:hypothetical protein n=1 Tax=Exiguobacterium sp. RIT594 TaxID=2282449 RepID=UPI000DF7BCAD|nr:hypothetical protein [Exiguobacterium sp. RIT594]RDB33427.1 hypothetical protein DVG79_01820 [Exiguobacterium sp. RIT594]